jgi:hypothetical protein
MEEMNALKFLNLISFVIHFDFLPSPLQYPSFLRGAKVTAEEDGRDCEEVTEQAMPEWELVQAKGERDSFSYEDGKDSNSEDDPIF